MKAKDNSTIVLLTNLSHNYFFGEFRLGCCCDWQSTIKVETKKYCMTRWRYRFCCKLMSFCFSLLWLFYVLFFAKIAVATISHRICVDFRKFDIFFLKTLKIVIQIDVSVFRLNDCFDCTRQCIELPSRHKNSHKWNSVRSRFI